MQLSELIKQKTIIIVPFYFSFLSYFKNSIDFLSSQGFYLSFLKYFWEGATMYEIFRKLLNERNVTVYRVSKETGISSATFTEWKNGTYTPKQDKIQKIADYFNVSVDYLLGRTDDPSPIPKNENNSDDESEFDIDTIEYALYGVARNLNDEEKKHMSKT